MCLANETSEVIFIGFIGFLFYLLTSFCSPLNLNKSFRNKSHVAHELPFIYYIYIQAIHSHSHTNPSNKCKSPLNLTILERHADYWKRTQSRLLCRSIEQEPPLKKLNFNVAYHLYIWRWRPLNWFGRGCSKMSPDDW